MKVAIMQPALFPPASYFRLFAASDIFVIYDDVQFARRWYTHRQQLHDRAHRKKYLTLPLTKMPRDTTLIKDLNWSQNYQREWELRCMRFPVFDDEQYEFARWAKNLMGCTVPEFIEWTMKMAVERLGIQCEIRRSSEFSIPKNVHGQNRIIAICKKLGATEYINSPGGKELYDEVDFAYEGIKLTFLPEWRGSYDSILERLARENPQDIRKEIHDNI